MSGRVSTTPLRPLKRKHKAHQQTQGRRAKDRRAKGEREEAAPSGKTNSVASTSMAQATVWEGAKDENGEQISKKKLLNKETAKHTRKQKIAGRRTAAQAEREEAAPSGNTNSFAKKLYDASHSLGHIHERKGKQASLRQLKRNTQSTPANTQTQGEEPPRKKRARGSGAKQKPKKNKGFASRSSLSKQNSCHSLAGNQERNPQQTSKRQLNKKSSFAVLQASKQKCLGRRTAAQAEREEAAPSGKTYSVASTSMVQATVWEETKDETASKLPKKLLNKETTKHTRKQKNAGRRTAAQAEREAAAPSGNTNSFAKKLYDASHSLGQIHERKGKHNILETAQAKTQSTPANTWTQGEEPPRKKRARRSGAQQKQRRTRLRGMNEATPWEKYTGGRASKQL